MDCCAFIRDFNGYGLNDLLLNNDPFAFDQ